VPSADIVERRAIVHGRILALAWSRDQPAVRSFALNPRSARILSTTWPTALLGVEATAVKSPVCSGERSLQRECVTVGPAAAEELRALPVYPAIRNAVVDAAIGPP